MRILLVVPGGVDPPGSTRIIPFIHDLVVRFAAHHDVAIIAIGHDPQPRGWRLFGCPVVNVPIGRHSRSDVARAVRDAVRVAGRGPTPDVVHGFWAGVSGLAAAVIGKRSRIPSVVSLCGGELASLPDIGYGGGRTRGGRGLARSALALADTTTAATAWVREHAIAAGARIDELVPLGADATRFRRGGAPPAAAHLVHVGSLNRVKDQFLALDAFARVHAVEPSATLTFVGADTLDGAHAAHAARLGIAGSVRFAGFVHPDDLADLYRTATLHLTTSRHEAGPLAVLEAAMCGVPTVGTAVGHVADLAAMAEPGSLVARRDPDDLAAAVLHLLADPAERRAIATRAEAWANAHDADHTAAAFGAVHRRLTARSAPLDGRSAAGPSMRLPGATGERADGRRPGRSGP